MYNAESALEPLGNNNSLYTPSAPPPCLSVSLCSNIQRICVLYSNLQMSHFSEAAAGGEKKKSKISMNTEGIWSETPGSIIAQRAPAERRRNAGEKEISRTRVPACHLNISFHACMPKAPHIHTEHTLSLHQKHFAQKARTHTHTCKGACLNTQVQESLELVASRSRVIYIEVKGKERRYCGGRSVMIPVVLTN